MAFRSKILKLVFKHKVITTIALLVIVAGGYFGYRALAGSENGVRYITSLVERGMLIVSVSGSGQVSVSDQVDIKPKVSGDVVFVGVENGQGVKAGELLCQIDTSSAAKAVGDAETALETARLELEELLSPPDDLTLLKSENVVLQAKNSLEKLKLNQETEYQNALQAQQKAEDDIVAGYEDAFNAVTNAFFDLPAIITGLNDILYSYQIADSGAAPSGYWNISALLNSVDINSKYRNELEKFIKRAEDDYKVARAKYNANFENYRNTSRYSEYDVIEALLEETLETTRAMAEIARDEINVLDCWVDYRSGKGLRIFSKVTEYQSALKSYTSKTSSYLTGLLSIQRLFQDNREAKLAAERSSAEMEKTHPLDLAAAEIGLREKEESLADLKAGPDELEVRAKKNTVQQKEDALLTAKQALANCYVYAPFDGIIAETKAKKGDSVSAGTVLVSVITKQKIAEITLNELDAAQVKVGQKATLQFDAAEDLSVTGEVAEVDTLGTVTQGVVSYDVKIAFDVEDERIKLGMSVSAMIIVEVKPNTLLASIGAVKTRVDMAYVEILVNGQPQIRDVTTGSSNDVMIEIVSGVEEGDEIVTQAVSGSGQKQGAEGGGFNVGMPGGDAVRGMMRIMR